MHCFANILMDDVYYSSLQHEENDLQHWKQLHTVFVYWPPDNNYPIISVWGTITQYLVQSFSEVSRRLTRRPTRTVRL